ncbi:volume-regulated anion channel subunit LRRC8D-like [Salvelinus namaycush]|uniref:Volume-regulated anion channel subunit LRRC8D-like n=1 Tax=Salvelinus namaycush TaxID=8040 RepID=A0A8U0QHJ6_SALNM|nr:volume-regulated anion channel subunit LRRC8D-like [Salvelinus namaycush]
MFSLSELASLSERQGSSKLLKPWWEVFMEYLVVLMLMVSVLSGTLLLSRDRVVCLPLDLTTTPTNQNPSSSSGAVPQPHPPNRPPTKASPLPANPWTPARGRRTHLDYQQYVYISQVCYHEALPWYSRFFPYVALLQSLVLLASGCFWFHFPLTSARIEHFLIILAKCCESPWTSRALSHAARQEEGGEETGPQDLQMPPPTLLSSLSVSRNRQSSLDSGTDSPLLVYLAQTVFKLLLVVLIVGYTTPLMSSISFTHTCLPQAHALTGYSAFECTHALASVLHKLLLAYISLVGLFGLLSIYTLSWILHSSLRQYSFNKLRELGSMRDVPDLCNDLAFLLHMADQYDPLLAQRLSVFLSPVSETRLLEESLERRWGADRLRSMTTVDPEGRPLLQLVALPRLPPALFTLSQLVVLKLELITDAKLPAQVANMTSLRELHLYHCTAAMQPGSLVVLQERLEALHLTFTQAAEIPGWVYSLRGLQELHLSGRLGCEGGVGRGWALGSLRQLRHLRVLVLRGMLQHVPGELGEVAGSLVKLEIHNEGSRLLVLTGLRRVAGLTELQLQDCRLERLPSALLALTSLRTLDLQHNSLRTLEELLGLAHLRHLSCLRLAHNRVLALPASVGVLRALELLDLGYNQLQSLPPALFNLHHLRRLLLAGNLLDELPAEVGALTFLTELDLSGNRLESLPPELFSRCLELRSLNVSHNSLGSLPPGLSNLSQLSCLDLRSNSLEELPMELGCCSGLHREGLLVEDWLLHALPRHVKEFLTQSGSHTGKSLESHSRPDSDSFPYFSATQWSFSSTLESRI